MAKERKVKEHTTKERKKGEKGCRLSLYERVYRELDATMIGAEYQRNVDDYGEHRYDMYDEICVDTNSDDIIVHSANRDRLNFAQRVAEHYKADYTIREELWRRDPTFHYSIHINVNAK